MKLKKFIALSVLAAAFTALGFAQDEAPAFKQEGIASWYGQEYDGKNTASGEIFDSSLLTAAHISLPFGTVLKVTNTQNDKTVVVRVNDRGPFTVARIIDVSRAAAEKLDMILTGTAPVVIETVSADATQPISERDAEKADASVDAGLRPSAPTPLDRLSTEAIPEALNQTETPSPNEGAIAGDLEPELPANTDEAEESGAMLITAQAVPAAATQAPDQTNMELANVTLQSAPRPPAVYIPQRPEQTEGKRFRLQVGSYKVVRYAAESFERLKKVGLNAAYERYEEYYRVVIPFVSGNELDTMADILGALGYKEVLIREER